MSGNRYYYVEPAELKKYFNEDIQGFRKLKIKLSEQIASLVNNVINHKENPGQLALIFKALEDHYPPTIIKSLIEVTKKYLNSSYFNYPGKFTNRSWFGGQIKYITENKDNPIILRFNDVLDSLIKKYDELIQFKLDSANKSRDDEAKHSRSKQAKRIRKPMSGGYNFSALFFLFSYSMQLVLGQDHAVSHDQNHFGLKGLSIDSIMNRLPELYHTISNAPTNQVRFWGFTETHTNFTHHQLYSEIIPAIGKEI